MVRSVTRQIEPEWDDTSRGLAEALARFEAEKCPGCGMHKSILDHPEKHRFTFESRVCAVCKAQDGYARIVAAHDEAAGKTLRDAPPSIPRPGDGRHIYLRPLTEDEKKRAKGGAHGGSPGKRSSRR